VSAGLRTEVAQLSIVAGARQENPGDTGLVERSSVIPRGPGKGNLYLLVQVTGDDLGKEEIHRELIEILSEEYFRVPGGVTNGLRQAIRAANTYVYERNLESLPLWQRLGETSCAVLRGNDLYVGLAGDALIYVLQSDGVRLFPPPVTQHLATSLPEEQSVFPPLGEEQFLREVGLFHCRIEEADIILLASSSLSRVATTQEVTMAAQRGLEELTGTLNSLASSADVSALLIQLQATEREWAVQEEPQPRRGARVASHAKKTLARRGPAEQKRYPTRRIASGVEGVAIALGAAILAFFTGLARRTRSFLSWLVSTGILGTIGRVMKTSSVRALHSLGTLTKRMLPEPEAVPRPLEVAHVGPIKRVSQEKGGSRLPLLGVFSIICVIAMVAIGFVIRNHSRTTYFSQLLEEARAEMGLARSGDTRAAAREHLHSAEEVVDQALEMRPTDPDAVALREELLLVLDEVNQVVRLQFSAQMPFAEPQNRPYRMLVHADDVYILDQGTQQLQGYLLDELRRFQEPAAGAALLGPESRVGGVSVEQLKDFVWMEAGGERESGNLLVLVNDGSLLQLDALRGFTLISVADSELWGDPRFIGGYSGHLYVLDAAEDRILKYAPTENTYDYSPTDYFLAETMVQLDNAVDMAIDGYIYVLLADGSIVKFLGGLQEAFSVQGLDDDGLENPTAIFASPETEYIYVADAGSERIVQLTKEGAFVRQFLPPRDSTDAFQDLLELSVNEETGELFVLTSEALSLALIPEAQHFEQ